MKFRSPAQFAADGDGAPVLFDDGLGEREPDADALLIL